MILYYLHFCVSTEIYCRIRLSRGILPNQERYIFIENKFVINNYQTKTHQSRL